MPLNVTSIEFLKPEWTLRLVRDRGLFELWFETGLGREWHDLRHLLAAADDGTPLTAEDVGPWTSAEDLQQGLSKALRKIRRLEFDERLEARLQEIREKAAEENLQEIFGDHEALSTPGRGRAVNTHEPPQRHRKRA